METNHYRHDKFQKISKSNTQNRHWYRYFDKPCETSKQCVMNTYPNIQYTQ